MQNLEVEFELFPSTSLLGNIIVIKKGGGDGGTYPLLRGDMVWTLGQHEDCSLRLRKPGVADYHCKLVLKTVDDDYVFTVESSAPTYLNGTPLPSTPSKTPWGRKIRHGDILTIPTTHGRQLRIEYPRGHKMRRKIKRVSKMIPSSKEQPKLVIPKIETPKSRGSIKKDYIDQVQQVIQTGIQQGLASYGGQQMYPSLTGSVPYSSTLLPVIQTSSYDTSVGNDQSILLTKVMDDEDRDDQMNQMYIKQQAHEDLPPSPEKLKNQLLLQVNNQMIIVEDSEALADILAQQDIPSLKNFTFKLEAKVKTEMPSPTPKKPQVLTHQLGLQPQWYDFGVM